MQLFGLFKAGRLGEMEALAAALTARHPGDGQAWKAWGVALQLQGKDGLPALQRAAALLPGDADVACSVGGAHAARGELDPAAVAYRRALQIDPASALAHCNLGDVLSRQSQWQVAEASCRQALRLQPSLAAAHLNLGNALSGQGRIDEAVLSLRQATALGPGLAAAHTALGIALKAQGHPAAAAASFRTSLRIRPGHVLTLDQLGVALHASGDAEAALPCWHEALRLAPGQVAAQVHYHLGNALADLDRLDEAAASFRHALALAPDDAEVHVNLGAALAGAGRGDEAILALRRAVALQPQMALAHSNLGNALMAQGWLHEALSHHRQAVALAPAQAHLHANLGHCLKTVGQPQAALPHFEQALALEPDRPARHSELLFALRYENPSADQRTHAVAQARRFGALATRLARPFTAWANTPDPARRLRVGLLSADLRQHPVGYFTRSVLASLQLHAAGRIAVHAYANQRRPDALSRRLQASCASWREVAEMDDAALATRIHDDGIDVLIDLSGHTLGNRLPVMAWRPAPVQASWLGYCATTGLAELDAFIADPHLVPANAAGEFVERIARLPETFLCFTPPEVDAPVGPLPALAGGAVHFGCFNHLAKLGNDVVALWARILHAVPHSRLVLQSQGLQDAQVRQHLEHRFGAHGIAAGRLLLRRPQPRDGYLAAYGQVDIALDPFPYPGGTTTLEALWMGVPVLTLNGASALSRQGASILRNAGLAGWVAGDADHCVDLAVRHSADLPALAALRSGLRQRLLRSPLCDAPQFASRLEACVRGLWQDWCKRAG